MRLIDADALLKRVDDAVDLLMDTKHCFHIYVGEAPTIESSKRLVIKIDPAEITERLRGDIYGMWSPSDEMVPDEEVSVLCQTITKKGAINFVIGYYADGRWCCGMNSNVVAWMPLPEPYREEK